MENINFNSLLIPLASSMVGLIPLLINLTVNYLDKKALEPSGMLTCNT